MNDRQHTQREVELLVLEVLSVRSSLPTQELTRHVKNRLPPSQQDARQANERPNETKIDQIIANSLQAKRPLCARGLIERLEKGIFRITEAGRSEALARRQIQRRLESTMGELGL